MTDDATNTKAGGSPRLSEELCSAIERAEAVFDPAWIRTSDWPRDVIPAGAEAFSQSSESGDCTIKGFFDRATGEMHVQEVLHNVRANRGTTA